MLLEAQGLSNKRYFKYFKDVSSFSNVSISPSSFGKIKNQIGWNTAGKPAGEECANVHHPKVMS